MRVHAGLLARLEEEFGVPPAVLVALWGIESSYGRHTGSWDAAQAILTLAYRSTEVLFMHDQYCYTVTVQYR